MNSPEPSADPLHWLREFRARLAGGEALTASQYAAKHQLSTTDELFVDLIFAEFLEREQRGDRHAEDAILGAYPVHAAELRQQILLHRSFQQSGPTTIVTPEQTVARTNSENTDSEQLPAIPGFEVIRRLGQGGMGVVLLARELQLGRLVAIKLLLSGQLSSQAQRQRFRAEARAAAALRHPNIVQVDDVGEVDGQPFIVMEYVAGGTLEEFLRQQRISAREAAQFIREIAWAVHAAHQAGIVHRDLKPGNLLLAPRSATVEDAARAPLNSQRSVAVNQEPAVACTNTCTNEIGDYEPKITDFGLAKSLHPTEMGQAALTVKGDVLGTPCYMSPEQARGDIVRPATDIYSLGSILYELLSGAPPFQRATPWETVQCVLEQPPPSLNTRIPADLRTICEKCLRKEPEERYISMAALAVDLGLFLQGRSISARRVGSWTRLVQWAKRNVAVASLLAVVGLTLCTLLIVSLWSRWTLQEMLADSQQAKRQESLALQSSREQLWENLLSEAQAIQTSRQLGQRYRSLENVREAQQLLPTVGPTSERQSQLRDTAIAALPLLDIQKVPLTSLPTGNQSFISADRKFQRMALRQSDGTINIIQSAGQTVLRHFPPDQANSVVISPDGRYLLVNHFASTLHSLDDESLQRKIGTEIRWPVFSEDSNVLAAFDAQGLFIHNIQEKRTTRIPDVPLASMPMLFSPEGSRLAVVCHDRLLIVSTDPYAPFLELPGPTLAQQGQTLAWHPGGDYLAAGLYSDRSIAVWHLPTRYQAKAFRVGGQFHNLQFDRSGQYLAAVGLWGGSREVFEFATQESLLQLPRDTGIAFGEDDSGSLLVLSGPSQGSLDTWRIENQIVTTFIEPAHLLAKQRSHSVLSSCGRWLLVNSEHGLEIYDAIAGRPAGTIPIGPLDYSGVIAAHDGDFMLLHHGGCQQWSLRAGYLEGPVPWPVPPGLTLIEVSADRRWGLCSDSGGVYLHDATGVEPLRFLGAQFDVRSASFDLVHGRIATGSWNQASEIIIWDLKTAREERRLNVGQQAVVRFSPDGNYLFTSSSGGSLWNVDSWQEWRLNSPDGSAEGFAFAFSPDSRWFAHTSGPGRIKIQDLQQRTTIADLTDPNQHHYFSLAFSADNSAMFGVTVGRECFVKRWDLKHIDRYLGDLQLPPLNLSSDVEPIKPINDSHTTRLQIPSHPDFDPLVEQQVLQRARQAFAEQRWALGLAELRAAVLSMPKNDKLQAELAWRLVSLPPEFQDAGAALAAVRIARLTNYDEQLVIIYAIALGKLEQHNEALSILTHVQVEGHPQILVKYFEAQLLAELERFEEAKSVLAAARELESQSFGDVTWPMEDWDRFRSEVERTVNQVESPRKPKSFRLKIFWPKNWSEFVRFCSELRYRWWGN
ncbi:MAG: protein kinase [Planctomycetaceae bacterium]|nr:protein kinase [Planctomycetaceae bacterium]